MRTASFISSTKHSRPTRRGSGRQTEYRVGISPPSFDKQFVRDWLEAQKWNKQPPAPALPADVLAKTAEKYNEALRLLTSGA